MAICKWFKELVKNCSINSPQDSNNTNIAETSVLQTGINQLESEKNKLESELEHARILNMELIKREWVSESEQVKSLNTEPINLISIKNSEPP